MRGELGAEQRLVADLTATGKRVLADGDVSAVALTAHERIAATDPVQRLRIVAALTSNVSLSAARTIVRAATTRTSRA